MSVNIVRLLPVVAVGFAIMATVFFVAIPAIVDIVLHHGSVVDVFAVFAGIGTSLYIIGAYPRFRIAGLFVGLAAVLLPLFVTVSAVLFVAAALLLLFQTAGEEDEQK